MNGPEYRWRVYRATFDTNIFFRALIRKKNTANDLMTQWLDERFILVLSRSIVDEIEEVASRPHLVQKYEYALQEVYDLVNLLTERASWFGYLSHINCVGILMTIKSWIVRFGAECSS